jgi:hypothetical protein
MEWPASFKIDTTVLQIFGCYKICSLVLKKLGKTLIIKLYFVLEELAPLHFGHHIVVRLELRSLMISVLYIGCSDRHGISWLETCTLHWSLTPEPVIHGVCPLIPRCYWSQLISLLRTILLSVIICTKMSENVSWLSNKAFLIKLLLNSGAIR